jgi:MinD-like ATPase involved in chromosome partitioning or flagellar assembly
VIVPIDADPRALSRSLALLRQLRGTSGLVTGAVVVGAESSADAEVAFRRLRGAAERQLGVSIVPLGELPRDAACSRSLLRGVPIVDLDAEAASARSLRALGARLVRAEPAPEAPP